MDPLSAVFSGIGGIASVFSANQAQQENDKIAMLNYQLEQQKEQDTVNAAKQVESDRQQQYGDTKLGYTDAAGNRVHFVEGQGWVTDETPTQQALDSQQRAVTQMQNTEQENKLGVDAVRQRAQSVDTMRQNDRANQLANSFANMISDRTPTDTNDMANSYGLASAVSGGAADDAAVKAAATAAVRGTGGTSNFAQTLSSIIGDKNNNWYGQYLQGAQQGRQAGLKENGANLADALNDFNVSAGQAKTPVGGSQVGPVQTNVEGDTQLANEGTAGQAQMSNEAGQLGTALQQAFTQTPTPQMDYTQPNNALGNAFASFGASLKGMGGTGNTTQQQKYGSPITFG